MTNSYDDYLDRITDEYNRGCVCYQQEISREECCKDCDTYCEEYLETLDLEELEEELKNQREYYETSENWFLKNPYSKRLTEGKIRLLLNAIAEVA